MTATDRTGYATAPAVDGDWRTPHRPLTDHLGCSATIVDAYRPAEPVALPADLERLCVPLDGPGTLDATHLERHALALVPAGVPATLAGEATWLVVAAPADVAPGTDPAVLALDDLDYAVPTTSSVEIARLTDRLGARGTKVNVRRLAPGDAVPYHTEGTQEELFVPLDGPGVLRVDGRTVPLGPGDVARVVPDCPRGAVNDGDRPVRWLMVGAPPTGGGDEWDPGAEIVEWPGDASAP